MKQSAQQRSNVMRAVKGKDTKPEMAIRRLVFRLGYRYRVHRQDLPGAPDLVFPGLRKVLFVNGCFWHGHTCARGARVPVQNREYWVTKISQNVARDGRVRRALGKLGWKALTVWECELSKDSTLKKKIQRFLLPTPK